MTTPKTKRVKLKAAPAYRPRKPVPDPTESPPWLETGEDEAPLPPLPPLKMPIPDPPPVPDPWEALAFAVNQINYLVGLLRSERNPDMKPVIDELVAAGEELKLVAAKRSTKGD